MPLLNPVPSINVKLPGYPFSIPDMVLHPCISKAISPRLCRQWSYIDGSAYGLHALSIYPCLQGDYRSSHLYIRDYGQILAMDLGSRCHMLRWQIPVIRSTRYMAGNHEINVRRWRMALSHPDNQPIESDVIGQLWVSRLSHVDFMGLNNE